MKLTTLIFLVSTLSLLAGESFSQTTRLSLKMNNAQVKDVLLKIENSSEFFFIYNNQLVDVDRRISIEAENKEVTDILADIFRGQPVEFQVADRKIVIAPASVMGTQSLSKITGRVTDATGSPLPGVSVVVKGSTTGVTTDADGNYSLANIPAKAIVQYSFVGMKTQEIALEGKTVIDVTLVEDAIGIEEVVAVGYGIQKKANLTGSVSSVSLANAEQTPYTNSSALLQGKVPGMSVIQASGRPGADNATIRIRGIGTLNDSNPLVLIDGMQGDINSVNPQDIESISVLKDAASAAIYGNRAANGVILVTTKKAKVDEKISIEYNGSYGIQMPTFLPKLLHAYDHAVLYNEALVNGGLNPFFTDSDVQKFKAGTEDGYIDTDWNKIFYGDPKPMNVHNLSLSGGGKKITSFLSLGFLNQEGIRYKQSFNRFNVRSNTQAYFLKDDKLHVQVLLSGLKSTRDDGSTSGGINQSGVTGQSPYMQLKYKDPTDPDKEVFGSYNGLYFAMIDAGGFAKTSLYNFDGQIAADYKLLRNLTLNLNYGVSYNLTDINNFNPYITGYYFWTKVFHSWGASSETREYRSDVNSTLNTYIDYNLLSSEKHKLKILSGYSQEERKYNMFNAKRNNLVNNFQPQLVLGDVVTATNGSSAWDYALRSYFGRLNYTFNDRYLFEANARYDGSSRFAPGKQWGFFPSLSAGWRVSKESFMANVKAISNLKLRASWGKLGNQNVDYYAASDKLSLGSNAVFNNAIAAGAQLSYLANKDISWETSTQANVGVDIDFLNKFSAEFDVYSKLATNVLRQLPVPATTGISSAPWRNMAAVKNTGWDFGLTYRENIKSVKCSATLNLSHFKNAVTDLGTLGTQYSGVSIITVGQPYLAYYGLQVGGIIRDAAELSKIPTQTLKMSVGDLWYKDQNGDGKISLSDDRVILGKPYPDLSYSLRLEAEWKGLTVSAFLQGEYGVDTYVGGSPYEPFVWGYSTNAMWKDRWTPDNTNAPLPRLWVNNLRALASDFYVKDASYLRFKDITVSYAIPKRLTSNFGIQNLMVYTTVHNAITITRFKDFDPERASASGSFDTFPQVKSFTIGIQLGL